jgi:putative serine/threonine protein kinase
VDQTGLTKTIKIIELENTHQRKLFSWPRYDHKQASKVINGLKDLGVETITVGGPQQQGKLRFLGKGHVGIVIEAKYKDKKAALKIRRTDADRKNLNKEAENLKLANSVQIGPKLYAFNEETIVMELINGKYFPDWLEEINKEIETLRTVLKELLEKTRTLDKIGLDHGELGKIKRHVIIEDNHPRIIDFESASTKRRPSNVTSISQFLFLNRHNQRKINEKHQLPRREKLIHALKTYKMKRDQTNFLNLLKTLKLE